MYHVFAVMGNGSGHKHIRADNLTALLDFLIGTHYDLITVFELQQGRDHYPAELVEIWSNDLIDG